MDNKKTNITESQQTRAYAAYYGLWVGLCWVASFSLFVMGLKQSPVGSLSLLVGLCSVPLCVWLLRGFRESISPLPLRRAWYLAWMTYLAAALLCTAAQYIYFAYIDGGLLVRSYSEMIQQPEMHDMLQRMLPGQDVDTLTSDALTALRYPTRSAGPAVPILECTTGHCTGLPYGAVLLHKGEFVLITREIAP